MAVWANDRHNISLMVVGILVAFAVVGFGVVLVGPHLFGKQAVPVVEAAGHAAVRCSAADLVIQQVILDLRFVPLVVGDLYQVPGLVVGKLRPVVDARCFIDMGLSSQPVNGIVLTENLAARRHLDVDDVAGLVVLIQDRRPGSTAVGAFHHVALLDKPAAGVVLPAEQLVDAGPQPAPFLDPAVLQVVGILHSSSGLIADFDQTVELVVFKADHMQRAGHTGLGLEVEIPALLDAVAGGIVFVLGQLVLRLAVCIILAWLAFLGQPAGIVVSIQRADAFRICFAGEITGSVDQLDDVAAEVVDIPFLYRPVRRGDLDQAVYFIVLVGIARAIVPFGIVIHGLDFLEDIAHGVVEDTLDALVRVDDPDLIVVGVVFAADSFAVVTS